MWEGDCEVCSYSSSYNYFSGPTGSIESPNYPSNYSNYLSNCYTYISVSSGETVVIAFSAFNTQPDNDYLTITCDSGNAIRLPRYSGTQVPAVMTIPSCTQVRLTFHTDGSVTNKGFRLGYSVSVTKACANTYFSGPTGTISSPNYPNYYSNNQDCNSYIAVPVGHTVVITFVAFYTNPSYDFVKITCASGANFTSSPYSGSQIPATLTIVSCSLVKVYFHSGSYSTYPGFSLIYMYNMTSGCANTYFSGPTGTISSRNYPNAYTNNLDCYSYISVSSGHTVIIAFVALNTQSSYDWVKIACVSGTVFTSTQYSGSTIPSALSLSSCNLVKVHFHTDSSFTYKLYTGFSLTFNITTECDDRHFSDPTGIISSPNYPLPYANYLDCNNYLSVPSGHSVILTFLSFNTQRYNDWVTITCSHGNVFAWPSYSGSNVPAALTIFSCNLVEVHFHSDGSVTNNGFSLKYSITPDIRYQNQESQVLILGAMLGVAALIITIILAILLICKCLQKKNSAADVGDKCDGNTHELQQREGDSNLYSNDIGKPAGVDQSDYDNPEVSRRRPPAEPAIYQALLQLKK